MASLPTREFGPLEQLHAAVRRRAPQAIIAVAGKSSNAGPNTEPVRWASVTYRCVGPLRIVWDERLGVYRWHSGPNSGEHLGSDTEDAAKRIAVRLQTPIGPSPSGRT